MQICIACLPRCKFAAAVILENTGARLSLQVCIGGLFVAEGSTECKMCFEPLKQEYMISARKTGFVLVFLLLAAKEAYWDPLARIARRLKKRAVRFAQFTRTLFTSALNEFLITGKVRWRVLPAILRALFSRPQQSHTYGRLWWRRLRGCSRCPLFDRHRFACGHLASTYEKDGSYIPLGCGCFLPLKADAFEARCWLWEQTNGEAGNDWRV